MYVTYGRCTCTCAFRLYAACMQVESMHDGAHAVGLKWPATWRVGSCRPGRGERAARAQTQLLFVQQYPPLAGCRVPRCRAMTGQDRAGQGMDGIEREEAGGGRKVCLSGLSTHGRSFPLIAAQAQGDVISQPSQPAWPGPACGRMGDGSRRDAPAHGFSLPACLRVVGLSLAARKSPHMGLSNSSHP